MKVFEPGKPVTGAPCLCEVRYGWKVMQPGTNACQFAVPGDWKIDPSANFTAETQATWVAFKSSA